MDEGQYNRYSVEELADQTVTAAARRRIGLVVVDEAGKLTAECICGYALVCSTAKKRGHVISFVLVGMDTLPQMLQPDRFPQLFRRAEDWCRFDKYTLEETTALLRALHPHFEGLSRSSELAAAQFRFVHEISEGLPGFIVPFVARFDAYYRKYPDDEITLTTLRAVHLRTANDLDVILAQARRNGCPSRDGWSGEKKRSEGDGKKKKRHRSKRKVAGPQGDPRPGAA